MARIRIVATLLLTMLSLIIATGAPANASAGLQATPMAALPPQYTAFNVSTFAGTWIDFSRPVASCSATGGTCTISKATSVSTTVQVSLGANKYNIAAQIGVSVSATSSTTVSCTSPKLASGQTWTAYPTGTMKFYYIREWYVNQTTYKTVIVGTSGLEEAFQPYSYPSLHCQIAT
jgi:hypothetical protein